VENCAAPHSRHLNGAGTGYRVWVGLPLGIIFRGDQWITPPAGALLFFSVPRTEGWGEGTAFDVDKLSHCACSFIANGPIVPYQRRCSVDVGKAKSSFANWAFGQRLQR